MPIYEYSCKNCGCQFDVFQSMGATNENLTCPSCGQPKPERIFSTFGSAGSGSYSGSSGGCSSSGPFT
ncbi:MAG: FmdB family zinc ribbon protein [Candidatus Zhuqueibacterota bacterium]